MFERPSRRSGTSRETLPEGLNWSGDTPGAPELVGRPSRRSVTARDTLPEVRNWSGGPPGGVVTGRETL